MDLGVRVCAHSWYNGWLKFAGFAEVEYVRAGK